MSATLRLPQRTNWLRVLALAGCLLLLVTFLAWLVSLGGAARALNDRRNKAEMTAESDAVCTKWTTATKTDKYAECLKDIQSIRSHQWERVMENFDSFGSGASRPPEFD